jgi:hypothetical protein
MRLSSLPARAACACERRYAPSVERCQIAQGSWGVPRTRRLPRNRRHGKQFGRSRTRLNAPSLMPVTHANAQLTEAGACDICGVTVSAPPVTTPMRAPRANDKRLVQIVRTARRTAHDAAGGGGCVLRMPAWHVRAGSPWLVAATVTDGRHHKPPLHKCVYRLHTPGTALKVLAG